MMQRRPAIVLIVCSLHLVLAGALLSAGNGRPSADALRQPGLVSVVLLGTVTPTLLVPTTPRPAAPVSRSEPRAALERPLAEVLTPPAPSSSLAAPAELELPSRSSGEHASASHEQPALAAAQAPTERSAAPFEPPSATTTRAVPPPLVGAQADRRLCPPAPHPAALRERGIEGAVLLRVRVDAQGRPADVQVASGSGWRLFDEAALQQVRACRFVPATQGGQAIDSWVEFPVRFALAG